MGIVPAVVRHAHERPLLINARSETIAESLPFAPLVRARGCLNHSQRVF